MAPALGELLPDAKVKLLPDEGLVVKSTVSGRELGLEGPLLAEVCPEGEEEVRRLHLSLAQNFDGIDWRLSAQHLVKAGRTDALAPLISKSLEQVLARGLERYRQQFAGDREAALRFVRHGESRIDPRLDPAELAAYAAMAGVLLNLDETVTKN